MDSASFQFLQFGLAVAIVSNFAQSRGWRSAVLLLASFLFLGLLAHDVIVFVPAIGFLILGYAALAALEHGWYKSPAWSVLAIIVAYVWLKKYSFLAHSIFLHFTYFTLGLSYIFFRVLHLVIEAAADRKKAKIGLGAYLLYTLNFTTFVSGPIQRYEDFARDQFANEPIPLGMRVIGLQLERIVRGFFKVNVLALLLHALQQKALGQMSQPLPLSAKMFLVFQLAVVYPFFLYANFSGYIDIVIALARLMRVRLPENFDRPFSASSFLEFWNRWHITLSAWLKTYVYNPLLVTLMRRFSSLTIEPFWGVLCFFVTFFLVGIWHGRTSEFVIFGVLQGGGVAINKIWQLTLMRVMGRKSYKALAKNIFYISFGRGMTFTWFAFTLFWFWANWKQIGNIFNSIDVVQCLEVWMSIGLISTAVLGLWEWLRAALLSIKISESPVLTSRYARVMYASAMAVTAFVISVLLDQPAPGIVYKAF